MNGESNIVLIGMPGAGKSTLGVLLAKAIGMDFIDTDILIQRHEKRVLQKIIDEDGIDSFLAVEESVVSGLSERNSVIATGGSVVYSEKAMTNLKQRGTVVFLHVSYEELCARLTNIKSRGIVLKKQGNVRDIYLERAPLYARYGDLTIDCTGKTVEACVDELLSLLIKS